MQYSINTSNPASFPARRLRRLRRTASLRALTRETEINAADFIYPIFVVPGTCVKNEIAAMPGQYHLSVDMAVKEAQRAYEAGIRAMLLFGIPEHKDATGSSASDLHGPVCQAVAAIKEALPNMVVITDICLCEYTDHGHCGLIKNGEVDNDTTLEVLSEVALAHARAGADMVAPSDMMDGRILAIRKTLDKHGFTHLPIMAYSAKYASSFYGPFREAAGSAPQFGDRRSYQMDPPNAREAMLEIESDIEEGADIVMVKPAMAYLDVVQRARQATNLPIACYNVSGEYAMVKAAAANGWIDEKRIVLELLTGIKRAGADMIITYHAIDAAKWLCE
ncbi:MAG: porphobilinogen synthase [bacterium]|nr:porphobilinogen synthase [bacterium]